MICGTIFLNYKKSLMLMIENFKGGTQKLPFISESSQGDLHIVYCNFISIVLPPMLS